MRKETAYATLKRIASIEDEDQRKSTLRNECANNNLLAIILQRCYHPNYNFNLPKGPIPPNIAKKSNHDEMGSFYRNLRRWDLFRIPNEVPSNSNLKSNVVEAQFIDLYESVASDDADLLVAIKDKELPWPELNKEFVTASLPELFPSSFRMENTQTSTITVTQNTKPEKSKREICNETFRSDPNITRGEFIKKVQALADISKTTASQYFYEFKKSA